MSIAPQAAPSSHATIDQILTTTPHLRGIALLSERGELMASAGASQDELKLLASFAIGARDLAVRLCEEAAQGPVRQLLIQAELGCVVVQAVGEDRLLFALTEVGATAGLLSHDLSWYAARLMAS